MARPIPFIFNPGSGRTDESARQLEQITNQLRGDGLELEVRVADPPSDIPLLARRVARQRPAMVIASGGDGTIDVVGSALVGTGATLGIVPSGTRNNVARSLDIPLDVTAAAALITRGRRVAIDVGYARCGRQRRFFLEAAAAGLAPALFPHADDIQHGDLTKLGDFLTTLVNHQPSSVHVRLDGGTHEATMQAHMVLAVNTPYLGMNFQLAPDLRLDDGLLDVLLFANLSKLDLVGYAVLVTAGVPTDPRIGRYKVREIVVEADPPMPVMVDGEPLGEGAVHIGIRPRGLAVIAGEGVRAYLTGDPDEKKKGA
jgi:YegS/Rv2252/BmrU family lipid kinase